MRYFDVNCFLGRPNYRALKSFPVACDLLREMDDIGIERAVVSHFAAQSSENTRRGNEILMRETAGQDRLVPCWIVHPQQFSPYFGVSEVLRCLDDNGIRMVRMEPGPLNNYSLHFWALEEFLCGLAERRIALYVDFIIEHNLSYKTVPEHDWTCLHDTAKALPDLNIILFAKNLGVLPLQVEGILKSCPNLYLDISSMQRWRMTEGICGELGAERLVFGSYMPYFDAGQFVIQIANADISSDEKEMIGHGNLEALLGR